MSQWVQVKRWVLLSCLGAVSCGGGDPETPRGGPPGGRVTIPNEAFGGAGATVGSPGGVYNYAGAPSSGTGGAGGLLTGGAGGVLATGGALATGGIWLSTGGSSPVAYCTGSATPCSLLGNSQCVTAKGCDLVGSCDGFAESCSSQFYSSTCYGVQGCYWSSYSMYCSGSARSCSLFSGSASCVGQPGCHWSDSCDGVVTLCSLLSEVDCDSQPGCYLEYR